MNVGTRPGSATPIWTILVSGVLAASLSSPARLGAEVPVHCTQTSEERPLRRVELLVLEDRTSEVTLGLHIELAPDWYLYWLNPGDAGLAPEVRWELPPGFEAGKLRFPTHQKFVHGDIVTYGFRDETLILCDVRRPVTYEAADKTLVTAVLDWMACRESCLTGQSTVQVSLSRPSSELIRESGSVFSRFAARYPKTGSAAGLAAVEARLIKSAGGWAVEIGLSGREAARASDFYPYPVKDFVIDHHGIVLSKGKFIIPIQRSKTSAVLPVVSGLLIINGTGFEVSIPVKE